jgi:ADP-heptose:LPS heptosyltransferase
MVFNPKNILVIDFGQLGDAVLSLPALRFIRERFPNAEITALAGQPADQVIALSRYTDATIAVDRVELRDGPRLRSTKQIFRLVRDVRRRRFDFVIDLHSLYETNLLHGGRSIFSRTSIRRRLLKIRLNMRLTVISMCWHLWVRMALHAFLS